MRIEHLSHAAFAALMIGLGIQGLITGAFTAIWQPIPQGVPAREVLVYLCALLSLASGIGLLWRRTARVAARVLLGTLVLWVLTWRVRAVFLVPFLESSWSLAETMVIIAATWVLYASLATDEDRPHLGFATGEHAVRMTRVLYGLAMITFGYAHFANLKGTAALVPAWIPWHLGWAYVTGGTFIAAGVAILARRLARPAAALSVLQIALFGLLVWVPILATGSTNAFQRMEFATTLALTMAGWVVADSYRCSRTARTSLSNANQ